MYQECRHIKTSGTKCGAPALKGKAYCYFHFRAHQFRHRQPGDRIEAFMKPKFQIALLEDRGAIQAAISETIHALAQDHMDHKRAGKILYGLHLALICVKVPGEIVATEPVRAIFQNEEGEEIGPEQIGYDETDDLLNGEEGEFAEAGNGQEAKKVDHAEDAKNENGKGDDDNKQKDGSPAASKGDTHPGDRPHGSENGAPTRKVIPRNPSALRQAITNYIADLKQNHPELAAHGVIKKMEIGLSSIP
jgi:hypothetical protein